jgi:hypothetical protein
MSLEGLYEVHETQFGTLTQLDTIFHASSAWLVLVQSTIFLIPHFQIACFLSGSAFICSHISFRHGFQYSSCFVESEGERETHEHHSLELNSALSVS